MLSYRFVCCIALGWCTAGAALADQHLVIVLDDSGSMAEQMRSVRGTHKIDAAKTALRTVLEQLPDDSQVGVVVLNGAPDGWLLPLGPLDKTQLNSIIQQITASGGTPLGRSMKVAADALLAARAEQHYGTYKLLIVTDGEAGDKDLVEQYLPDIVSRGLLVDVIGVDMKQDHSLATQVNTYRRADDPSSLQQAISEVVLGESTSAASDVGESDFEVLAGLPDDVAVGALRALTAPANQPIGDQRPGLSSDAAIATQNPNAPSSNTTFPNGLPANQVAWGPLAICGLGCVAVVFILAVGAILVLKK